MSDNGGRLQTPYACEMPQSKPGCTVRGWCSTVLPTHTTSRGDGSDGGAAIGAILGDGERWLRRVTICVGRVGTRALLALREARRQSWDCVNSAVLDGGHLG